MPLLDLPAWLIGLLALPILLNLWSIWHAGTHEFPKPGEKHLWILLAVILPIIGGIVYLVFGRPRVDKRN